MTSQTNIIDSLTLTKSGVFASVIQKDKIDNNDKTKTWVVKMKEDKRIDFPNLQFSVKCVCHHNNKMRNRVCGHLSLLLEAQFCIVFESVILNSILNQIVNIQNDWIKSFYNLLFVDNIKCAGLNLSSH